MDPLERMAQLGDQMRALRSRVSGMEQAWPAGDVFHGEDATGALRLELTSKGRVSRVDLDNDWTARIPSRSLAMAVNQALGAASAKLGATWLKNWNPDEVDPALIPERPRSVTLEEYWAANPPPKTREELREKAERVAERREARQARERELSQRVQGPGREQFMSPRGRFTVTRSQDQLTGLESLPNALATMTPADVGREIVAILDEIHHRALGDDAGVDLPPNSVSAARAHNAPNPHTEERHGW